MQFSRDQYNEPQVHGLKCSTREFSGSPVVRTHQSHSRDWVPSLVGELLTQCTKKKKKGRLGGNNCSRLLFLLLKTILFMTPWTAAHQASLSSTIFWSLHKLMSIEPVMPSNRLILCHPLLLLLCLAFMSQLFTSGGQKIGASASALPVADELEKNSSPQVTLIGCLQSAVWVLETGMGADANQQALHLGW